MLTDTLKTLFSRDLDKLKQELELYNSEDNIWRIDKDILNSAGNLCLHLVGNLNTYFGTVLGNTGYIRNRPEEFSLRNTPRQELIVRIEQTIKMLQPVLDSLTDEQLQSEYPQQVFDYKMSTEYFLVHLEFRRVVVQQSSLYWSPLRSSVYKSGSIRARRRR